MPWGAFNFEPVSILNIVYDLSLVYMFSILNVYIWIVFFFEVSIYLDCKYQWNDLLPPSYEECNSRFFFRHISGGMKRLLCPQLFATYS